jgi:hypothetical protein
LIGQAHREMEMNFVSALQSARAHGGGVPEYG